MHFTILSRFALLVLRLSGGARLHFTVLLLLSRLLQNVICFESARRLVTKPALTVNTLAAFSKRRPKGDLRKALHYSIFHLLLRLLLLLHLLLHVNERLLQLVGERRHCVVLCGVEISELGTCAQGRKSVTMSKINTAHLQIAGKQ